MLGLLAAVRRMSLDGWALGNSHSRKPDRPVTNSSPFSMWLSVLFFFSFPAKTTLSGQGYGSVGGGGNIAIATALPPSFVYCIVNIKQFMDFLYHNIYAFMRLRFLDVETNLARGVQFLMSAEYSNNVRGLVRNLSDLTVALSQYDILLCSEMVSDKRRY